MTTYKFLLLRLMKPITYNVVVVVLLIIAYWQVSSFLEQMVQSVSTKQNYIQGLQSQVLAAKNDIAIFEAYSQRFKSLDQKGLASAQPRAQWIDRLMEIIARQQIHHASIRFSKRSSLNTDMLSQANVNQDIMSYEEVQFEGVFQHEGELLNFLQSVTEHVYELSLLHRCEVSRKKQEIDSISTDYHFLPEDGNLKAKCNFFFVTVDAKKSSGSDPVSNLSDGEGAAQ